MSGQLRGRNTGQLLASLAAEASWAPPGQGSGHLALEDTFDLAREASVIGMNRENRNEKQKIVCVCTDKLK